MLYCTISFVICMLCRDEGGSVALQYELIQKLKSYYGSSALFFWNSQQGDRIGLVWRPYNYLVKTFSLLHSRYKLVIENNDSNSIISGSKNSKNDSDMTVGGKIENFKKSTTQHVVVNNVSEMLGEMLGVGNNIISDINIY